MTLNTNRLTIDSIDPATAAPLVQFNTYTAVRKALSAIPEKERGYILVERDETNTFLQQLQQESNRDPKEFFGIFLAQALIGVITLIQSHTTEYVLQIEIAPQYRRQGYGYESVRKFVDDLFSQKKATSIRCYTLQESSNIAFLKKLDGLYHVPECNIQVLVGIWDLSALTPQAKEAKKYTANHKPDLENDTLCGCSACGAIYHPSKIQGWIIDHNPSDHLGTALCPYCNMDCVIGQYTGYPITEEFLSTMNRV